MSMQPGQTILNGKYQLQRLIGEGGMARVWLAEELTFGHRRVAIKEPRTVPQSALAHEIEERYRREVQVCAALEQAGVPHIVRALTAEPSDGGLLLVMEYMPGGDLAALLREHPGGLPVEQAVSITLDLLRALEGVHAHELEIVHRDIKPSNVLFDGEGRAHLADFGLAQLAGMSGRSQLAGGQHPGTPMYMAPEQEISTRMLTPATDIFALGCVLFEMLAGQRYKRHQPGTRARALRPDLPPWLDDIVAKALEEDPWQRWRDAGEMAGIIQRGEKQWAEDQARLVELDRLYKEAGQAADDRQWEAALLLCDRIEQLEPDYRDIRESRREIETNLRAEREAKEQERARQLRLAGWYADAEKLATRQPQEALALIARIRAEAPDYPNLGLLERKAQSTIAAQKRQQEEAQATLAEQRRQQEEAQPVRAFAPERARAVPARAEADRVTAKRSWLLPVLLGAAALVVLVLGGLWASGILVKAEPTPTTAQEPVAGNVTIVIGYTTSRTGVYNVSSLRQVNGLTLWMNEVNDAGGIQLSDGTVVRFEAKTYDDESLTERVQELYTRLATEDDTDFLISPYSSGLTAVAASIADRYGKIMIATGAASDSTYQEGYTRVFQAYTPTSRFMTGAVDLLAHLDPNVKRLAFVYENDRFSTDVVNNAKVYAESLGYEIVLFESYDSDTKDFGPFINKILESGAEAILGGGHFQDGNTFARQVHERDVDINYLALLVAPPEPDFADLGDAAIGAVGPSQWDPLAEFTPESAEAVGLEWFGALGTDFAAAYRAAYNEEPSFHSMGGYAAGQILQKAIIDADSTDPQAVKAALEAVDMLTAYGRIKFDTSAENHGLQIGHSMIYIQWQKNDAGNLTKQVVWPLEGKTADALYPRP